MSTKKQFTIVNIGRNVGDQPLSKERWLGFIGRIKYAVNGEPVGYAQGSGQYEGQKENFATFHFLVEPRDHELNRENLAILARDYGQEAIAYMPTTDADLVSAALPTDVYL
jgi:hypothetical protein